VFDIYITVLVVLNFVGLMSVFEPVLNLVDG
jgi:hypothetical protein